MVFQMYDVFTKVLHIPPADTRTFGLMIQALGMTAAAVNIFSLIVLELVTTIWLVTFDRTSIRVTILAVILCTAWFGLMLQFRRRKYLPGSELHGQSEEPIPA